MARMYTKAISNAKKILIEVDRFETLVIKTGPRLMRVDCRDCGLEVVMVDLDSAVTIAGRGAIALMRDLDRGFIHSFESPEGYLRICSRSLIKNIRIQAPAD